MPVVEARGVPQGVERSGLHEGERLQRLQRAAPVRALVAVAPLVVDVALRVQQHGVPRVDGLGAAVAHLLEERHAEVGAFFAHASGMGSGA